MGVNTAAEHLNSGHAEVVFLNAQSALASLNSPLDEIWRIPTEIRMSLEARKIQLIIEFM